MFKTFETLVCEEHEVQPRFLFLTSFTLLGQVMLTPAMQGILMAIDRTRSVCDRCGPEAAFFKVHLAFFSFPFPFLKALLLLSFFVHACFFFLSLICFLRVCCYCPCLAIVVNGDACLYASGAHVTRLLSLSCPGWIKEFDWDSPPALEVCVRFSLPSLSAVLSRRGVCPGIERSVGTIQ